MTKEIAEFRGVNPEDSLIEVKFKFERPYVSSNRALSYVYTKPQAIQSYRNKSADGYDWVLCSAEVSQQNTYSTGITVDGSKTSQGFQGGYVGQLGNEEHTIILKLVGEVNEKEVEKITTTRDKKQCPTCGLKNDYNSNYCNRCGTFLR